MKPKINEKRIIGAWIKAGNNVYGDENCKRIEWLIDNYLRKMVSSKEYGDWEILYQDPQDGRYWEKIYPLGEVHGGGPPSLVNISKEDAKIKYGINEDHGKNMKMSGQRTRIHLLLLYALNSIKYDASGNVSLRKWSSGKTQNLQWNAWNQLLSIEQSGDPEGNNYIWSVEYDGLGRRIVSTSQGINKQPEIIKYAYDPEIEFQELARVEGGKVQ